MSGILLIWRILEEALNSDLIVSGQHPIEVNSCLSYTGNVGSAHIKVWEGDALFEAGSFMCHVQGISR